MIPQFTLAQTKVYVIAVALLAMTCAVRAAEPQQQSKPKSDASEKTLQLLLGNLKDGQTQGNASEMGVEELRKNLEAMQQAIKHRDSQIAQLVKELSGQQHKPILPPLENGQVKVYSLSHAPVQEAAAKIEGLFGTQTLRVAADERTNSLIVYGKPDSLAALDTLMTRVDEAANRNKKGDASAQAGSSARSLLLRLF